MVSGHRRGRILGFPTANVGGLEGQVLPKDGVYCGLVHLHQRALTFGATISMGWNQTFDDVLEHRVEAHIHDFSDEIYDLSVEVTFVARLRGMVRFNDMTELARQIACDVHASRLILASRQAGPLPRALADTRHSPLLPDPA